MPLSKGGMGYRPVPQSRWQRGTTVSVMHVPCLCETDDDGRVHEDGTFYAAAETPLSDVTWGAVVHVLGSTDTPFQIHLVNSSRSRSSGGEAPRR